MFDWVTHRPLRLFKFQCEAKVGQIIAIVIKHSVSCYKLRSYCKLQVLQIVISCVVENAPCLLNDPFQIEFLLNEQVYKN